MAAVVGYLHEGRPLTWSAFADRMRLQGMGGREWKWTLGGLLVLLALNVLVSWVAVNMYSLLNFTQTNFGSTGGDQLLVWGTLLFNIVGEELWWRGYILPRQELAFGGRTWLLHGVMWACFHMYKWWTVPLMMITCPVTPFVAQRLKNTTAAMVIHFTLNALGNISFVVLLLMQLIGAH